MSTNARFLVLITLLALGCTDNQDASKKGNVRATATKAQLDDYQGWLVDLESNDGERVKKATENLESAGPTVIPFLIDSLKSKRPRIRKTVHKILVNKGDALEAFLPQLLEAFQNDENGNPAPYLIAPLFARLGNKSETSLALAGAIKPGPNGMKSLALQTLRQMGKEARPAIPQLIKVLDQEGSSGFLSVLSTLEKIGCQDSEEWFKYLQAALPRIGSKDGHKRKLFNSLKSFGDRGIPTLVPLLMHPVPFVSTAATNSLKSLGPKSIPLIIEIFEKKGFEGTHNAVAILDAFGKAAIPCIPILEKNYLANRKRNDRSLALIAKLGEPGIPSLLRIFKQRDDSKAAYFLCRIGPKGALALATELSSLNQKQRKLTLKAFRGYPLHIGKAVEPYITKDLKSTDDEQYRLELLLTLKAFGASAEGSIPALSKLFLTGNERASLSASRILVAIGAKAAPVFLNGVQSESASIRLQSIRSLKALKDNRDHVHSMIAKCLYDKNQNVRMEALQFLSAFKADSNKSIPALVQFALSGETKERFQATTALREIGSKEACLALTQCLKTKNKILLSNTMDNLSQFKTHGEIVFPALLGVANNMAIELRLRYLAIEFLPSISSHRKLIPPALLKMAEDIQGVPGVRRKAILTLGLFSDFSVDITPCLLRLTSNQDQALQAAACVSLGKAGLKNKAVIDALTRASKASDPDVNEAARFALENIRR